MDKKHIELRSHGFVPPALSGGKTKTMPKVLEENMSKPKTTKTKRKPEPTTAVVPQDFKDALNDVTRGNVVDMRIVMDKKPQHKRATPDTIDAPPKNQLAIDLLHLANYSDLKDIAKQYDDMARALRVIHTWAKFDMERSLRVALCPRDTILLTERNLKRFKK